MGILQKLWIAVVTAALVFAASSAPAAEWTIVDLGALPSPNGWWSSGGGINEAGQVVGISGPTNDTFAVDFSSD